MKSMSVSETTREKMTRILRESQPLTAEDIITVLSSEDLTPKDAYEHLKHIAKAVKSGGRGLGYGTSVLSVLRVHLQGPRQAKEV